MKSLEKIEIAVFGVPTRRDVLERLRRNEPCRADLLSLYCTFASGKDDYLLRDMPGSQGVRKLSPLRGNPAEVDG